MTLKGMCYKAGGYARRNDPHRREYYSNYPPRPGPTQTPASGQDVSPIGGCGVAIFMLGGLLALACPPLGVIVFLVGGLIASGSAVASNRREQSGTSAPPLPIVPAAVHPDVKCVCGCCGQDFEFSAEMAGQQIACPACQQQVVLPRAKAATEV
jgi:DNA-directed RNA polymerase subunit RPC12/RpoP